VLSRAGHTEAGCDLARLAGFDPSAVIVEIMNDDGSMARRPDLEKFAEAHNIKIGTIADLIHYQVLNEQSVECVSKGKINTDYGPFDLYTFRDKLDGEIHFAMTRGDIQSDQPTLVRVHLASTVRDLLGAQAPDRPNWNLQRCLKRVADENHGVVVLLHGRETADDLLDGVEIALGNTPPPRPVADGSGNVYLTVGLGSQILREVGVGKIRLMGPPIKYNAISGFELEVVEFVPAE
jgi:3,4-dihydroxy 2-butanone 4-phosphate synthase/GTP cyclohydrolase II